MKSVIFDLDGTLLDTLQDLFFSVNATLEEMGLPLRTKREIRAFLGNGARNLLQQSLPDHKKDRVDEALAIFQPIYALHSQDTTSPYPGITPLLEQLKKDGFGLGIVSNKPDFAVQTLGKNHFPIIPFAVGEREGIRRKPNPDSVLEAMRALGSTQGECVYVGDSEVDVATAIAAGIPCIAVTWGFRDREALAEAGATVFADTAEELYERIGELI